jgi:archaellum component FlaC
MDEQHLRKAMGKLRSEIDQLEAKDAHTRARLGALVEDIERIDRSGTRSAHEDRNILERLEDEIASLEATYPSLTVALNDVLEVLTSIGI